MNSYRIDFNRLRNSPIFSEMLMALERGFMAYSIDYYLVGAVARDLWLSGIHDYIPGRTTSDVDFAVLVDHQKTYADLKTYLIEQEGFALIRGSAFALTFQDKITVDLLPFGSIEDADGTVTIESYGLTRIHLQGFKEVYAEGLADIQLGDDLRFRMCTLPGLVMLKLIAWDDKKEVRFDDLNDIGEIMKLYFDMNQDTIWESHSDLFGENLPMNAIAAYVLGRDMKRIAISSEALYSRIDSILSRLSAEGETHLELLNVGDDKETTMEDRVNLYVQMKKGFNE